MQSKLVYKNNGTGDDNSNGMVQFTYKNPPGKSYCRYMRIDGVCKFGDNCKWAHTYTPGMKIVSNRFQRNLNKCYLWQNGYCKFGVDNCFYLHRELTEEEVECAAHEICEKFKVGSCDGKTGCPYHHGTIDTLPSNQVHAYVYLSHIPPQTTIDTIKCMMQPYHPFINSDVVKMYPSRIASGEKTAILTFVTSQAAYYFIDYISCEGQGMRAIYKDTALLTTDDINTYLAEQCQECTEEGPTVEEALATLEDPVAEEAVKAVATLSFEDAIKDSSVEESLAALPEQQEDKVPATPLSEKADFVSLMAPSPISRPPSPQSLSFTQIYTLVELFQKASLDPRMEDALKYMPADHPLRPLGDFIADYSSASSV